MQRETSDDLSACVCPSRLLSMHIYFARYFFFVLQNQDPITFVFLTFSLPVLNCFNGSVADPQKFPEVVNVQPLMME